MIAIVDNGIHKERGELQYLWFHVRDQAAGGS